MTRGIVIAGMDCQQDKHIQSIEWLKSRLAIEGEFKADDALSLTHVSYDPLTMKADILAVVALNNWTPSTCEAHIASDQTGRWATRDFLFSVYDLAFNHCGRSRMNFQVDTENEPAVRMHDKLGHKRECLMEDCLGDGKHAFLYGLTKKQWMNGRFAKRSGVKTNE